VCGSPIRGEVAYSRTREADPRRIYAHPDCYYEELPAEERERYRRELLPDQSSTSRAGDEGSGEPPRAETEDRTPSRDPEAETAIEVDELAKTYPDGTEAVRSVSFTVDRGEVFGVLGPNGAGKSTLIGMLGTLVEPSAGRAQVAGVDVVVDPSALKPKLGFAMQEVGVDELATGREFLDLQGRLYGLDREETRRRREELLATFDLEDAADRRIASYSGGMQRRIDLAGALIHEPDIVFLDEPTEGLDPRGRREMWALLENLNEELGATILLSTHYMEEADALCDRLAIMDQGRIVARGRPERLKADIGQAAIELGWPPARDDRRAEARSLLTREGLGDEVREAEGRLYVYVQHPARAIPPLLRRLEEAGLAPESLGVQEASLDDVYLASTGRSLEEAEMQEGTA
jgi:ABC-2 type transport system ATP-binding protein